MLVIIWLGRSIHARYLICTSLWSSVHLYSHVSVLLVKFFWMCCLHLAVTSDCDSQLENGSSPELETDCNMPCEANATEVFYPSVFAHKKLFTLADVRWPQPVESLQLYWNSSSASTSSWRRAQSASWQREPSHSRSASSLAIYSVLRVSFTGSIRNDLSLIILQR